MVFNPLAIAQHEFCMNRNKLKLVEYMFDHAAERYAIDIEPVFGPLIRDFVAYAAPRHSDCVLDIGSGIGILARTVAPYVRQVVGLDISQGSLKVGRETPSPLNVQYVQADIHHLPFPHGGISLVLAHFGLNATFPNDSLRAICKVVTPGGRFVIQEWGPVSEIDRAINKTLRDFIVPQPDESMRELRADVEANPSRWGDYLQEPDDYREWLRDFGLTVERAEESEQLTIRIADVEDYLRYKLAWTYRWKEVRAMDAQTRLAFYTAVRARMDEFAEPDGSLLWRPALIRVTARRENE
jgi:ubiquinone/menaquinone biosynthesis C-methylase UbiE